MWKITVEESSVLGKTLQKTTKMFDFSQHFEQFSAKNADYLAKTAGFKLALEIHMSEKSEPKFKKAGRKAKISSEMIDKICNTLRAGSYLETAAAMAGVSKTSLYKWLKKGNAQRNSIYGEFVDAVERAQAESEVRDLLNIDQSAMGRKAEYERDPITKRLVLDGEGNPIVIRYGAKPSWQASAWRLERKFPKKWGRLDRIEATTTEKSTSPQVTIVLPRKKELPE